MILFSRTGGPRAAARGNDGQVARRNQGNGASGLIFASCAMLVESFLIAFVESACRFVIGCCPVSTRRRYTSLNCVAHVKHGIICCSAPRMTHAAVPCTCCVFQCLTYSCCVFIALHMLHVFNALHMLRVSMQKRDDKQDMFRAMAQLLSME